LLITELHKLIRFFTKGEKAMSINENALVSDLITQLATDKDFLQAVRQDVTTVISRVPLPNEIVNSILASNSSNLRGLYGVDDEEFLFVGQYTKGDKCSTACTQAGCYTEGKCPSKFGCSGNPPKCS
jgi:hypothetical protein